MFDMTTDELWPRVPDYRYRLVAVVGAERRVLAAAPDGAGIGAAMVTWHEDEKLVGRKLCDLGRIGVLDTMPDGEPSERGEWIVLPYDRTPS